jgi:hypothetical protein
MRTLYPPPLPSPKAKQKPPTCKDCNAAIAAGTAIVVKGGEAKGEEVVVDEAAPAAAKTVVAKAAAGDDDSFVADDSSVVGDEESSFVGDDSFTADGADAGSPEPVVKKADDEDEHEYDCEYCDATGFESLEACEEHEDVCDKNPTIIEAAQKKADAAAAAVAAAAE